MAEIEEDARLAQLTAEMAWLRRLARALLRSDEGADLAHETWLVARDHVPADGRPLRPWLGRVARNLAISRGRARQRREVRERESASLTEPGARPDELVQRVELQKLVATEVLGLAEPYRSTVLLHYFEELTCAEMARRLKLPEGTVRRRLKVALDELRARLDRRTRTSGAGLAALAPLAGVAAAPGPSGAAAVGVVAMKKIAIAVLVLLALLAGAVHWDRRRRLASRADPQPPPALAASRAAAVATPSLAGAGLPSWMAPARASSRHVAGHVVAGKAPVAGARVELGFGIADDPSAMLVATVTTGSDGSFDFGPQPGLRFAVGADAPGYVARALTVQAGDPDADPSQIVLRLGACHARMSGTITDSSGAGIANALVATAGFSGTRSGEQGHYELCAPSGIVTIRVAAPGYGTREVSVHVYGDLRRDFTLVPEASIAGVVVDRASRPIAGAVVTALPDLSAFQETTEVSLVADGQGRFQLDGLAPGKYDIVASGDGLGSEVPAQVLATPARPARDIRVVVARRSRISGRVVMAGEPVKGARIRAQTADGTPSDAVFSDADGRFVLSDVPRGQVTFSAWPYAVQSPDGVTVGDRPVEDLTLEVSALGKLHGRVTRRGQPVPDAQVRCSTGTPKATTTDADGEYAFDGLPPGPCRLAAEELDVAKAFSPAQLVMIAPGEDRQVDLQLDSGAEARGVVVDEHGQPVAGVDVTLHIVGGRDWCEALSQPDGTFDCVAMRGGGDYRVAVYAAPGQGPAFPPASGGEFPVVHVADGNSVITGLRIAIANRRASIRGRVVDDGGAPFADVAIRAIGQHSELRVVPATFTDANGAFEIRNLAPGTYSLHARAPDGAETQQDGVPAPGGDVALQLAPLGSIDGELEGFAATPSIWAVATIGSRTTSVEPVVDGSAFRFVGLAPARYVVMARTADDSTEQAVVVVPGGTAHVTLTGHARGRIEGTVIELATKAPIAGMTCSVAASSSDAAPVFESSASQGTTDAGGTFRLPAPSGSTLVMCASHDPQLSAAGAVVDVSALATSHVELVAVRAVPPLGDAGFELIPWQFPATVRSVDRSGAAAAAGLQPGDQLVAVDDTAVACLAPGGAMAVVRDHPPGSFVTLAVVRSGSPLTLKLGLR